MLIVVSGCGRIAFEASEETDDAGAAAFCDTLAAPVTFCSDFAQGSAGFATHEMINGTYTFERGGGPTPDSDALVIATNASPGQAGVSIRLQHPTPPTTRAMFGFDVRIDTTGSGSPVFGLITFDGPTDIHGFEYIWIPPGAFGSELEEFMQPAQLYKYYDAPTFAPGDWHRLEVAITLGVPWTAITSIDGQSAMASLFWPDNGPVVFHVGIPHLGDASQPWVVRMSNVVVDVQ